MPLYGRATVCVRRESVVRHLAPPCVRLRPLAPDEVLPVRSHRQPGRAPPPALLADASRPERPKKKKKKDKEEKKRKHKKEKHADREAEQAEEASAESAANGKNPQVGTEGSRRGRGVVGEVV